MSSFTLGVSTKEVTATTVTSPPARDSQVDSQLCAQWRRDVDVRGLQLAHLHLERTWADGHGGQNRGLQNRLRGAVEASWVGSIPIHPRQLLAK